MFVDDWRRFYANTAPLSFAIRNGSAGCWLRFHALPGSKRYPETPAERQEAVTRANTIGAAVLGEGSRCWLVQAGDVELGWPQEALAHRTRLGLAYVAHFSHDETTWPIYAALVTFVSGDFDDLFLEIADDRAFRTLWMSPTNGNVFAPYDGGIDLFLQDEAAATFLRARHSAWLSARTDGM